MTFTKFAVVALTAVLLCAPTRAQEQYPNRLITLVAPITAGTAIDILARLYADKLSKRFGQQVVVANRAGAGGMIGAQAVATAAPDGYTLLFANSGHAILGGLNKNLTFDPVARFCRRVAGRRSAGCRRGAAFARRVDPQGIRRAREVEARHDQLRLGRHRHIDASRRRLFRAQDRHRPRPHSLHGERDHHCRPARRTHPGLVRADGVRAASPCRTAGSALAVGARNRSPADRDPDCAVAGLRLRLRHLVRHAGAGKTPKPVLDDAQPGDVGGRQGSGTAGENAGAGHHAAGHPPRQVRRPHPQRHGPARPAA